MTGPTLVLVLAALVPAAGAGSPEPRSDPWALLLAGDAEEAAESFAGRIAADPADGDAAAGLVRSLIRLDRWREALKEARACRDRLPGDPRVLSALAEALYRAGSIDRAGDSAEGAAKLEAVPGRSAGILGLVRAAQGRDEEASVWLSRAREGAPADRDVLLWGAGAAGSREEAVRLLESYLRLSEGDDPDRIEAARGTARLYRSLGERPVWAVTRRPDRATLPLEPVFDRPGRPTGYRVAADLGGGKPLQLLLDTGSPGLFVLHRKVRRHGLLELSEETVFGGGGDRRHETRRAILPRFGLGGVGFEDALASVTRREFDPTGRYHGVIGIDAFRGYRVVIDLARDRLEIDDTSDPLAEGEPYWTVAGQILVEASAGTAGRGLWLLDTGATRTVLAEALLEHDPAAEVGGWSEVRGFGGALARSREIRGVEVRYQGRRAGDVLHSADLSMRSRLGGVEIAGFLGLDVLEGARIVIDTRSRRVLVESSQEGLGRGSPPG